MDIDKIFTKENMTNKLYLRDGDYIERLEIMKIVCDNNRVECGWYSRECRLDIEKKQ